MKIRSLGELATQVELARRLNYIGVDTATEMEAQLTRTAQLLHGILRSLRLQAVAAGTAGALVLITTFVTM